MPPDHLPSAKLLSVFALQDDDLVAELLRQGVSDADVAKIVGLNVLRVWDEVDAVAEKLQKERLPAEDEIVIFPEGTSEMHV